MKKIVSYELRETNPYTFADLRNQLMARWIMCMTGSFFAIGLFDGLKLDKCILTQ